MFGIELRRKDDCPEHVDAMYIPSYCLTWDKSRLTSMSLTTCTRAMKESEGRSTSLVVISGAYPSVAGREIALKQLLLGGMYAKCTSIGAIVSTTDEMQKLRVTLESEHAKSVCLVVDEFHAVRAQYVASKLLPGISVSTISVRTPIYEFPYEPNLIKVLRLRWRFTWALWNVLLHTLGRLR